MDLSKDELDTVSLALQMAISAIKDKITDPETRKHTSLSLMEELYAKIKAGS